jgi:hypothetical protein
LIVHHLQALFQCAAAAAANTAWSGHPQKEKVNKVGIAGTDASVMQTQNKTSLILLETLNIYALMTTTRLENNRPSLHAVATSSRALPLTKLRNRVTYEWISLVWFLKWMQKRCMLSWFTYVV